MGIKGKNLKEAFMAYVNNPQDIYQEKINPKNLDEADGAKNLRQIND